MNEYENVVTLTDEDGVEVDFEILDVVPYHGGEYAVLLPVDDASDVVDAVILEVLASGEDDEERICSRAWRTRPFLMQCSACSWNATRTSSTSNNNGMWGAQAPPLGCRSSGRCHLIEEFTSRLRRWRGQRSV